MFKKFPSYFSIIAAIIFILTGLFIGLTPYIILIGVVIVIIAAFVLGFIVRVYLESIFPQPEEPQEEVEEIEAALTKGPELDEKSKSHSDFTNLEQPISFEPTEPDTPMDFADFSDIPESGNGLDEDNIDENEE
ncbi:MAG: hypothetical protein FWE24_05085 [Defluviitaleaceae bacterium]|nr:hypothetical protein [Defluviitaleaceae bacterium]